MKKDGWQGEIGEEWFWADKIAAAYEKGKKTAAENLAKCKSRQKEKTRRKRGSMGRNRIG